MVAVLGIFLAVHHRPQYHWLFTQFYYDEAPAVRAFYAARGGAPQVVEIDDGIIAFATRFPTLSGTGFMLDVEAAASVRQNRFWDLAFSRGYRRAASLVYMTPREARTGTGDLDPEVIARRVEFFRGRNGACDWQPEYVSPSGNVIFMVCRDSVS